MTTAERLVEHESFRRIRAERLIATGRVVLAGFSLLALALDPSQPVRFETATSILLAAYLVYALTLAAIAWMRSALVRGLDLATHVADLALFTVLISLTEAATSPFFVYFTFALVAATLRWRWRGAIWTAVAAVVAFNATAIYDALVLHDPSIEQNRWIIRGTFLAVLAGLLIYVGKWEERRVTEIAGLAAWPPFVPASDETVVLQVLEAVAGTLAVPRVLLISEDPDEPWVDLAMLAEGRLETWRDEPGSAQLRVAEPLAEVSFLCSDAAAPAPWVLRQAAAGAGTWRGAPLSRDLQARFGIRAVLCLRLKGELLDARLLALDRRGMTADDLFLGEAVARQAAASLDHLLLLRRLAHAAAAEERVRLSWDLHDGLLQSMSGAALKLKALERLIGESPRAAREELLEIERLLLEEQRDLRFYVEQLRPVGGPALDRGPDLETSVRELLQRIESVWNVSVQPRVALGGLAVPRALVREICRIVQESVVNAVRHGRAGEVRLSIEAGDGEVLLVVADNGQGFRFRGRRDHAALAAGHFGPVMLRERVAFLGGTLAVESAETGARLEIRLPLEPVRV